MQLGLGFTRDSQCAPPITIVKQKPNHRLVYRIHFSSVLNCAVKLSCVLKCILFKATAIHMQMDTSTRVQLDFENMLLRTSLLVKNTLNVTLTIKHQTQSKLLLSIHQWMDDCLLQVFWVTYVITMTESSLRPFRESQSPSFPRATSIIHSLGLFVSLCSAKLLLSMLKPSESWS